MSVLADHPGTVACEVDGEGIAWITITNPARRNAVTYPMMTELFDILRRIGSGGAARVVVLRGAEGHFCSGIDLAYLAGIPSEERGYRGALTDDGLWNITACPLPVIAAVDGVAVGMGAEWTSLADVRIATTRARFSWPFVSRGLVPDTGAGTWLLPRLIGVQQALRLLYSGDWLEAAVALEIGYVTAVVEPAFLEQAAREEARRFLAGAPGAITATKRLLYDGLGRTPSEHHATHRAVLMERFASDEHREGMLAFGEKRVPDFDRLPGAGSA